MSAKTIIPLHTSISPAEANRHQREAAVQELRDDRQRRYGSIMAKLTVAEKDFVVEYIRSLSKRS